MNWTVIAALSELTSALLVGVSLIYLASQVRLSNRLAKAEAWRVAATKGAELTATQAGDLVFRRAFQKMYAERATRDDMAPDERTVLALWFTGQLTVAEQLFREVELGVLPKGALDATPAYIFTLPYFHSLWPILRSNYDPKFAARIDKLSREGATEPENLIGASVRNAAPTR